MPQERISCESPNPGVDAFDQTREGNSQAAHKLAQTTTQKKFNQNAIAAKKEKCALNG